ncbi:TetR/AcrR family transcriptional regulator [uncultured Cobetia sp.]|jgi:AcrR family transcriptional regulator|uniref:TetR/AcrR family transcriptional regulator n=1 Tax=uncultured Cobetia sp. TaxID=410706 RepID=UPI002595CDFB|nr:TetR/AcrR family transcriptional regulator [uncultured Cobetia sp.]|tara:strand:+ start:1179 stop:1796 length:618 start_codon:yes stop_codon:yes gene_type:complete
MNVATASPRRKELVRIAARLFVEEGFDRTTVRMLAQEMGIKSGSLFHHFADKQEILCAVIEEGMFSALAIAREHLARCEPCQSSEVTASAASQQQARERLLALARAHLDTLLTDRNAHVVALYEWRRLEGPAREHLVQLRDDYEDLWRDAIASAVAAGLLKGDAALLRQFMLGALNWTVRWYRPEGERSPDELAEALVDSLCRLP